MHIERHGIGPRNILCLHGWSGDHHTFDPLAANLPGDLTLWCPDLPGCGRSSAPALWTLDAVSAEIADFASSLGGPLEILGTCSGALFALEVALRIPVTRVIMVDAFAYWPVWFRVFLAPGWGHYAYYTAFANPVGRWLTNRSLAKHRTDSTNLTNGFERVNHATTLRYLRMLAEVKSVDRYLPIRTPIELLYGEKSFRAIRDSAAMWQRVFPGAPIHELAGAGHLPIAEATSRIREILLEEAMCTTASMNSAR